MSSEKAPSEKKLYFSYFIGRCNPPHQGHFNMINTAINAAREKSGKALILLGSGPKVKYGTDRRTETNPLTFYLKKEIIEKNINCENINRENDENQKQEVGIESVILEEDNYEIVEMENPITQVIKFVETELNYQLSDNNNDDTLIKITVEHFCGEKELKEESKMKFYQVIQEKLIENITNVENNYYNNVEIDTHFKQGNVQNEAGESMSATQIRTDAFNSKDIFKEKHSSLYKEDTEKVYDAIILGKKIGDEILEEYTASKTRKRKCLSTKNSTKKSKSGGKRKINKRRKTNKRKKSKTKRTNKRKK